MFFSAVFQASFAKGDVKLRVYHLTRIVRIVTKKTISKVLQDVSAARCNQGEVPNFGSKDIHMEPCMEGIPAMHLRTSC